MSLMASYNGDRWDDLPNSSKISIERAAKNDDWPKLVSFMESSLVTFETMVFHISSLQLQDPFINVLIAYQKKNMALEVIELLADPKAELEKKNFKGDTALHVAASMENITISKAILNKNRELISITNNLHETPLHKAALNGHKDMFWELVKWGSNVEATRSDEATVLHCAVMHHHFELALEIAQEYPDLIVLRDKHGLTVLHHMVTMIEVFGAGRELNLTPIQSFFYKYCIIIKKEDHRNAASDDVENRLPPTDDFRIASMNEFIGRDELVEDPTPTNIFKELYENTVKNIKLLITTIMRRLSITWLIELKEKHEFAQDLLTLIAKNNQFWTSLSKASYKEMTHDILVEMTHDTLVENKPENNIRERSMETPLTLGAKMGLDQLVVEILQVHPGAAKYLANDGKNILHVAVEYRQVEILKMVELSIILEENAEASKSFKDPRSLKDPRLIYWLTSTIDNSGNTILHLAAKPMSNTSSPMQMVEEFKWFERVKKLVPGDLVNHRNNEGKTALEVFSESHKEMVEDGKRQLTNTARSACAALVSAVTFAAGFSIASDQEKKVKTGGTIYDKAAFDIFSHSYMVGLSFGAMALVQFMSLLMSSFTEQDFRRAIPTQYFLAIMSLFLAMLSMLVSFACNTYVSIYGRSRPNWKTITPMVCEITIFPLICLAILRYQGVRFRLFSIFKSLMR